MSWLSDGAPVLKGLITAIVASSVPGFEARYRDEARPFMSPDMQQEILLQITSVRQITEGFFLTSVGAPTPSLTKTFEGMRDFTLQVQVRSLNQTPSYWALELAEKIGTRLWRDSARETLLGANMCVVDVNEISLLENVKVDDRIASVAILDVFMRAGFTDTDGAEIIGWFDHIELTSHVDSPAGVEYPSPSINVVDDPIPEP